MKRRGPSLRSSVKNLQNYSIFSINLYEPLNEIRQTAPGFVKLYNCNGGVTTDKVMPLHVYDITACQNIYWAAQAGATTNNASLLVPGAIGQQLCLVNSGSAVIEPTEAYFFDIPLTGLQLENSTSPWVNVKIPNLAGQDVDPNAYPGRHSLLEYVSVRMRLCGVPDRPITYSIDVVQFDWAYAPLRQNENTDPLLWQYRSFWQSMVWPWIYGQGSSTNNGSKYLKYFKVIRSQKITLDPLKLADYKDDASQVMDQLKTHYLEWFLKLNKHCDWGWKAGGNANVNDTATGITAFNKSLGRNEPILEPNKRLYLMIRCDQEYTDGSFAWDPNYCGSYDINLKMKHVL